MAVLSACDAILHQCADSLFEHSSITLVGDALQTYSRVEQLAVTRVLCSHLASTMYLVGVADERVISAVLLSIAAQPHHPNKGLAGKVSDFVTVTLLSHLGVGGLSTDAIADDWLPSTQPDGRLSIWARNTCDLVIPGVSLGFPLNLSLLDEIASEACLAIMEGRISNAIRLTRWLCADQSLPELNTFRLEAVSYLSKKAICAEDRFHLAVMHCKLRTNTHESHFSKCK